MPRLGQAARVWWSFTWRYFLLWFAAVLVIAVLAGLFGWIAKPGKPALMAVLALTKIGSLAAMFWAQIEAMRRVMNMDWSGFSLRTQKTPPAQD